MSLRAIPMIPVADPIDIQTAIERYQTPLLPYLGAKATEAWFSYSGAGTAIGQARITDMFQGTPSYYGIVAPLPAGARDPTLTREPPRSRPVASPRKKTPATCSPCWFRSPARASRQEKISASPGVCSSTTSPPASC